MRSRFLFFLLCCLAVARCSENSESQLPIRNVGESLSNIERQTFPNTQEKSSFGQHGHQGTNTNHNEGSTFSRPVGESNQNFNNKEHGSTGSSFSRPVGESNQNFNTEHSSTGRPTGEFGQNSNNQHLTGSIPNNHQTGGSGTFNREGENHPSGSRPSSSGSNSFERPTGSSGHTTDHREGEKHQLGSRPSNTGDHSFGGITDHNIGENRPSGSRPSGSNSVERPTGSSGHTTDHRESEEHQSGFRPSNTGDHSFGGITDHKKGENRPSITGQHGEPTGEFNQETGGSHQNQFSNGPVAETVLNNATDVRPDKEEEEDVCFTHLGCFKMGKPWKTALRPIGAPHGPEKIQTTIFFYSRENLEKQKNITLYPEINMGGARFDPSKITAMIVHGFSNSGNATWMKDMKNVYLKKVDANVMIVDWGKGAQLLNYFQVAGNTRVVGKQLGVFVKFLRDKYGADPGKFHLIGHSLGAQICSYVGKEVQGIARLTAMDPAQPAFEGFDPQIRLDKNDAEFVDVIHTDARPFIPTLGLGMITPHGHVDFYMNGGFDQPGCVPPAKKDLPQIKSVLDLAKFPVEVIAKAVACPHARSYEYLTEAFNETENCIFWGHKADAKNVFKSVTNTLTQGLLKKFTALSTTCSKEDCIPLGFATKKSPLRGVFVVTTNGRMPYCISEPGVPPETAPQERKHESFIQKIGKKTKVTN